MLWDCKHISSRLHVTEIGRVNGHPIHVITGGHGPRVFLTAGIHGNEPAGIIAHREFLRGLIEKYLDLFHFTIIPCINPTGAALNTRNNAAGVNLNRHFVSASPPEEVRIVKQQVSGRYAFSLDHHEDPTDEVAKNAPTEIPPEEAFVYEKSPVGKSKGRAMLDAIENAGYPICKRGSIYEEACDNGLLWTSETPTVAPGSLYVYLSQFTDNAFILETPTCWPLKRRVQAHLIALEAALRSFL